MRIAVLFLAGASTLWAQNAPNFTKGVLHIYAVDVEGGKATLYVSPSGESMLVDAGYAGNNNRDAGRILAAVKAAGIRRIDHLVVTHYHQDHAGGVPQLAAQLPIGKFYDHGENREHSSKQTENIYAAYVAARGEHAHQIVRPGDTIPVKGLQVNVVTAAGKAIATPLSGGGQPNALCDSYQPLPPDTGENSYSIGLIIIFGKLRISDLGDLYWNQEHDLVCPFNKIGNVDLYMTTHHGTETSGSPQIVHAMHPKVAIMNNGADKGGSVKAWTTIEKSPGLEDLWQLHYSNPGGKDHNVSDQFIANPSTHDDLGYFIEVLARADGTVTVSNNRNGYEKTYRK